jgi:hypothetical protein
MTAAIGFGVFTLVVLVAWRLSRAGLLGSSHSTVLRDIDTEIKDIRSKEASD